MRVFSDGAHQLSAGHELSAAALTNELQASSHST
jgi:hypothetical protein